MTSRLASTTSPPTLAPFDVAKLPRVSRRELAAGAQGRALGAMFGGGADVGQALGDVIGAPVEIVAVAASAGAPEAAVSAAFVAAHAPAVELVVEVEGALARELVGRALKQPPTGIADPGKPAAAEVRGAFAAVVVAAARRLGHPLRLTSEPHPPDAVSVSLRVLVEGAAFDARVTAPRLPERRGSVDLARLGDAPLGLPLVATSCLVSRAELAELALGDIFLPGLRPDGRRELALVAPRAERGLAARVGSDEALVVTREPVFLAWDPPMTNDSRAPIDVALEAPVVVRVEVGSVQMTAREWAALRDGDVIATGVKLAGSPVVLRVGGVELARGELVDVEGEYGVRITGMNQR